MRHPCKNTRLSCPPEGNCPVAHRLRESEVWPNHGHALSLFIHCLFERDSILIEAKAFYKKEELLADLPTPLAMSAPLRHTLPSPLSAARTQFVGGLHREEAGLLSPVQQHYNEQDQEAYHIPGRSYTL